MPRLTFSHHTIQTTAAIHAEAELNHTVSNPLLFHEIIESGESPHKQFRVIFYYPGDKPAESYDGKEWRKF